MRKYTGYCGTYSEGASEGIYAFEFQDGILSSPRLFSRVKNSKYIAMKDGMLASLADFDHGSGAVLIDGSGEIVSSCSYERSGSCYIGWHGDHLYTANYHAGTVSRLSVRDGKLVHDRTVLIRDKAGCHMAMIWQNLVLVPCLFLDEIRLFDLDLNPAGSICFARGTGPRHGVFSRDGEILYLVSELSNEIFAIRMADRKILSSVSVLPDGKKFLKDTAAVRLSEDGRKIYVSTRTQDILSVIDADPSHLKLLQTVSCGGSHPRDFVRCGSHLIVANRYSGSIVSFRLQDDGTIGLQESRINVPQGVSLIMEETK